MAEADEAYKWLLCEALPELIEAGQATTPFAALSEATARGESMGYRTGPESLKMAATNRKCFVYVAGSPEGVVGGGQYNYVECVSYRSSYGERLRMSEVDPERAYLGGILGTCDALAGWTYEAPAETGRYRTDRWLDPETGVEVLAQLEESRTGCKRAGCTPSVQHEVALIVRAANPSYIDPDEAFRLMQEKQAAEAAEAAQQGRSALDLDQLRPIPKRLKQKGLGAR